MGHYLKNNTVLGILGGGQLGKMLLQKAADFNIKSHVLDPDEHAPCKHLCHKFEHGNFNDYHAVLSFGNECDIITIEIEHVNIDALKELESVGKKVFPQPHIIEMVQDKGLQKLFYKEHGLPTSAFYLVEKAEDIRHETFPVIQKLRKGGYDGKGVKKINSIADLGAAFNGPAVIEVCIDIDKEIAVIVARNTDGEIKSFPVVEMEFNAEANLVELLFSPSNISENIQNTATLLAEKLIDKLQMVGLLAVEMFVTKTGDVLINEIAPRPHNSGHHTIEANSVSQFEQHLRAIFNLPLGSTEIVSASAMVNLLGEKGHTGIAQYNGLEDALKIEGAHIHLYGKETTKPFRKMGHATLTATTTEIAIANAKSLTDRLKIVAPI